MPSRLAVVQVLFLGFIAWPRLLGAGQPAAGEVPPPPTDAELKERVKHWVRRLYISSNSFETEKCRNNLVALGKNAVVPFIEVVQEDIKKPLPFHIWNVCLTLGRMADDRAVLYLLKRLEPVPAQELKAYPDWNYTRAFAALALGKIPDPANMALGPLRKIVAGEKEPALVRRTSALALGVLQDEAAIQPLALLLLNPQAPSKLRAAVAMALGTLRVEAATSKLLEYLALDEKSRDPFASRMAVLGLGLQRSEKAVEPLRKLLAENDPSLQGSVALVLGWIGNRAAADEIQKLMHDDRTPIFTRCNAAVALGGLGKPEQASEFLRKVLQANPKTFTPGTVAYAAIALGEFLGDENLRILSVTIENTHFPVVALNAIIALGHRKDTRLVDFLKARFHKLEGGSNQYLRGEIVRALLAHSPQESIRTLLFNGVKDSSDYVQAKSAVALARYPGSDTEAVLIECLADRSYELRGEAALTLGVLKSAKAVEPLRKLLKDDYDWVRLRSRLALENIIKFGQNEFHQTAGIRDLIDQRLRVLGGSLKEELDRLYDEGYRKVLELDRPGKS